MSLRGEITIECDVKGCHAEEVIDGSRLWAYSLAEVIDPARWSRRNDGKWVCEQCVEEGKQP